MRFTIDKEQFLKALVSAGKAVASKTPTPILLNLKVELNDKGLEVTGSNNDITVRTRVPYMSGDKDVIRNYGAGSTLTNGRILTEVVRRMEGNELSFEVIDESVIKIDDGKSSFKLKCIKGDEYPDIDLSPNGVSFDISTEALYGLVEQSAFAASTKEQRPILTALNLEASNGSLVATATDSARLAHKHLEIDQGVRFSCNIPAKTAQEIVRMFEGAETVRVCVSEKKVLFFFDTTVVSTRLVAGDYPVTKSIIPHAFNYFLEANAQELLNAMQRVSVLSSDKEQVVRLSMREDEVEISTKSDVNGSANEKISTFQFSGDRLDVSFNSTFVIDAIKAVKSEDVTLCFMGEMKPFVVKNPKDDSVIELITPMRTY